VLNSRATGTRRASAGMVFVCVREHMYACLCMNWCDL